MLCLRPCQHSSAYTCNALGRVTYVPNFSHSVLLTKHRSQVHIAGVFESELNDHCPPDGMSGIWSR